MLEQIHRTCFTVYDMNSMMSGILHESTNFIFHGRKAKILRHQYSNTLRNLQ